MLFGKTKNNDTALQRKHFPFLFNNFRTGKLKIVSLTLIIFPSAFRLRILKCFLGHSLIRNTAYKAYLMLRSTRWLQRQKWKTSWKVKRKTGIQGSSPSGADRHFLAQPFPFTPLITLAPGLERPFSVYYLSYFHMSKSYPFFKGRFKCHLSPYPYN